MQLLSTPGNHVTRSHCVTYRAVEFLSLLAHIAVHAEGVCRGAELEERRLVAQHVLNHRARHSRKSDDYCD